jgi:hypothetical protein
MRTLRALIPACLALVVLTACSGGDAPDPAPSASATPEQPRYVFYMLGNQLLRFDTQTSFSKIVADLPSDQVAVGPSGKKAVFVQESSAKALESGFREPIIRIGRTTDALYDRALTLGVGEEPVWDPLGTSVAAISDGEQVVYDAARAAGQEGKPLPSDAEWADRMWEPLETIDGGLVEIDNVEGAAWSPQGTTVAVWTKNDLRLFDVETGEAQAVARGASTEDFVWAANGTSFAFSRQRKGALRDVAFCTTADDCKTGFSWKQSVKLIALTV